MIESALCSVLENDAAVAALVGTRVYAMPLPQDPTLPAITYQRISTVLGAGISGPESLARVRVQVDCWATTVAGVAALGQAVLNALHGYSGTVDAVAVRGIFLAAGGGIEYESETKLRRVSFDFTVHCDKGDV